MCLMHSVLYLVKYHKTIVLPPSHKNCPSYLARILRRKLYIHVPFLNYTKFVSIFRNETIILG